MLVEAAHLGEEERGGLVDAVLLGGAVEGEVAAADSTAVADTTAVSDTLVVAE